ncbi:DUF6624 domain-containing protein [Streptomyces sp. GC420]|uniref:DUF6624 domain-containing protein n=1 Tax=Streptomyces sp. GC420 TaxID=2697568 RepID=UPI0014151C46|nr:DUF6624 domain-containing protein [Streptomyces sp. GC420]NBM14935.1 hypothetical protein [Streptomyces sp. GC420]
MTYPPIHRITLGQDLAARAAAARPHWQRPGFQLAAMSADEHAAVDFTNRVNGQILRRIVARFGWPGHSMVGEAGCQAALEIAVHCDFDPPFQRTLLRQLHTAVTAGEAHPAQWAHLLDRCRVRSGDLQVYGTQHWFQSDGHLVAHPICEPEGLEVRRLHVGLPPYEDSYERLRRRHETAPSRSVSDVRPASLADIGRCAA